MHAAADVAQPQCRVFAMRAKELLRRGTRYRQPSGQDEVPGATVSTLARTLINLKLPDTLRVFREALVVEAMAMAGSNKTEAASLLGIHRRAIERILRKQDDGE